MNSICQNIKSIQATLPATVCLVAVSKTHPVSLIEEAYKCGQRHFGENRVQELSDKQHHLPDNIKWHLIGHLQSNKVKYIARFVYLIHSVDSLKLLTEIDRQGQKHKRVINCLLQMYIASEETKFGLDESELEALLNSDEYRNMQHIRICGLMGMATNTADVTQVRSEFATLKNIFTRTQSKYFAQQPYFKEISMGMSGDYEMAVAEGSTIIRVGSSIFGNR